MLPFEIRSLCFAALLTLGSGLFAEEQYVVTDFGAVADGSALNTAAIQSAIDAAARKGGGTVVIPAGVFRSGSLFLKSGVGLRLAAGAVLRGSENIADYPKQLTRIEGQFIPWRMALINAQELTGLRLSGPGKIDGRGPGFWAAFWQRRKEKADCTNLEVERPRLLFIDRCRDVRIDGLTLENAGFWNIHLYRCAKVLIEGVSISTPEGVRAPSTDGIDIDSSQKVTVRHCRIAVDDDCIALKGSKGPRADRDTDSPPVEDILVEQCEFGRGSGVLTCGSEATVVRRVVVRDCTVTGPATLLRLKLRPDTPQRYEDILIDRIRFSGGRGRLLEARPWRQFFDLQGLPPPRPRVVNNLTVRNLSGEYGAFGVLSGNPGDVLRNITLENIRLELKNARLELGPVEHLVMRNVVVNGKEVTVADIGKSEATVPPLRE